MLSYIMEQERNFNFDNQQRYQPNIMFSSLNSSFVVGLLFNSSDYQNKVAMRYGVILYRFIDLFLTFQSTSKRKNKSFAMAKQMYGRGLAPFGEKYM